ncbi:hypothetical protein BHM03_00020912 [Ensete ventricosum]|nr:hypothetical protein BHM03_00020912 [Ensete ventricosum]
MPAVLVVRRAPAGGGADLTCVRSAVRQPGSSIQPVGQLRWVGHVDGPDVRSLLVLGAVGSSTATKPFFLLALHLVGPFESWTVM